MRVGKCLVYFLALSYLVHAKVRNIPKRFQKDWRLCCNVCNIFIHRYDNLLNISKQDAPEYDYDSKIGFRLDANGKRQNLKQKKVDVYKSEVKLTEALDVDICFMNKAIAVVIDPMVNRPVRILQQTGSNNKYHGFKLSRDHKFVSRANLFCTDFKETFYDKIIDEFYSRGSEATDTFCKINLDSRCNLWHEERQSYQDEDPSLHPEQTEHEEL